MAPVYRSTGQFVWFLICLQWSWIPAESGKLLAVPVDGSHWLNMKTIVEELHGRGHQIVVVYPEHSLMIKASLHYTSITYFIPFSQDDVEQIYRNLVQMAFYNGTFYERVRSTLEHISDFRQFVLSQCEYLLFNTELMEELAEEKFDALLTDPFSPCGAIVGEYLTLPIVNLLRGIPCGLEYSATQCPRPLSFVPRMFTGNTDRMTFLQRAGNMLISFLDPLLCYFVYSPFEELATRFLKKDVTLVQLLSRTSIWLMRYDFILEYPRPLMPNMVLVGGINCKERKPLPQDLEEFMNSSGEHGAVIFSLGSMVSEMPISTANRIAEAFGQIPQKVLWRHSGERPSTLAPNTKLMDWLPQNDLLAHPKTRAFLTHGGTHGIYEAICSAVPMVMLPLFGDQMDNTLRMMRHGTGIILNLKDITSRDLVDALNNVINNTRYKETMMRMSSLHKDRPVEPLALSVYWVEFVMKHRGAKHLQTAAHHLSWVQYHCLDVIGILLAVALLLVYLMFKCCSICLHRVRGHRKNKLD
ncbi:UDP-glucuronosyltransferase 1-1-like isoform X2 [Amblyraja radiata]|uniref:UDP-glucuronosyltransferase 1-1-like isoform X2 n=1 Tax=Amblyraja radiata TaxID=386614 RepID=UPI001401F3DD|nr:UDP-glucuronosyltransferase 1-1-like isoform X2 [Amblyraja radiata]